MQSRQDLFQEVKQTDCMGWFADSEQSHLVAASRRPPGFQQRGAKWPASCRADETRTVAISQRWVEFGRRADLGVWPVEIQACQVEDNIQRKGVSGPKQRWVSLKGEV